MAYILEKSPRSDKKWRITTPSGKKVEFGSKPYEDFTIHKDESRKNNYISRHEPRENWTVSGIDTAGFWSRWLLWNLPDFMDSVKDIESRFGIKIDIKNNKTVLVPTRVSANKNNSDYGLNTNINSSVSLPPISLPPLTVSNNTNIVDNNALINEYNMCKEESSKRKEAGKLKLCPEGYCTVKLTEEVYPSYWANLKASKICTGELEDLEGKIKKHYERPPSKRK